MSELVAHRTLVDQSHVSAGGVKTKIWSESSTVS